MGFSNGKSSITLSDIQSRVSESKLLAFYLGIYEVPTVINSPLRQDKRPSFGLHSPDGKRIYYTDLANNDRGSIYDLLEKLWQKPFKEVLKRINQDIPKMGEGANIVSSNMHITTDSKYNSQSELLCKIRDWRDYDIDYWESYGISLPWLKYAEIYPISHKIIVKNGKKFVFNADKYAYAYVEHKEGKVTLKIYQPFNKVGYKWSNKHDRSVISLWTKVPKTGFIVCICSSMKDALCLWANTNIPCIAIQGEGYDISETAIKELRRRFKNVCIMLDNDDAGINDAIKLSESTGFTNVVLPKFDGGKDISDYFHILQDKNEFKSKMLNLFKTTLTNLQR